ncbi:sigma-70 family RNA polymerase sigma factor [Micromonospora sp. ALFpr18c]|uniref:sigma-70 family RNA polymerase sigma factor n=1 Tax=unclassified Micromonospora TaxID=2617518 RepID=UPI001CEC0613|nr:sigma-70 family RNA polymerase sigma factor [Micromonospora sp. ALFpr18c]
MNEVAPERDTEGMTPEEALEHLQQVQRPALLAYVSRLVGGDVHWAEDVVQETMVRAWKNPDSRVDGRWSRGWLYTVARRILIDQARAARSRPELTSAEALTHIPAQDAEVDSFIDGTEIRAAVAALPERLRTVLIELYYQERTVAEAAQILNVPAGTVKSRNFYAIRALRDQLA